MNRDLQTILLGDNPWLLDPSQLAGWLRRRLPPVYLPRQAASVARGRWGESDRAHLVIGPRQAGKSTAIWAHLAERGEPALFLDCEQELVREWCRSAPLFLADLEKLVPRPVPLFFEEIQHLEEAGLLLKGLVDRRIGVPVLVTGSSSYHLGARTRESLAGRASRLGRPVFSRSLRSFLDAYRPATVLVVTPGLVHRERAGATEVEWIHPIHLAERVEAIFAP